MEITDSMLLLSSEVNDKINTNIKYVSGILIIIILLSIGFFMHYFQKIIKKHINNITRKMVV